MPVPVHEVQRLQVLLPGRTSLFCSGISFVGTVPPKLSSFDKLSRFS